MVTSDQQLWNMQYINPWFQWTFGLWQFQSAGDVWRKLSPGTTNGLSTILAVPAYNTEGDLHQPFHASRGSQITSQLRHQQEQHMATFNGKTLLDWGSKGCSSVVSTRSYKRWQLYESVPMSEYTVVKMNSENNSQIAQVDNFFRAAFCAVNYSSPWHGIC